MAGENGEGHVIPGSPACSEFAGALLSPHPSRRSCLNPALALPCLTVWPWTDCCPLWTFYSPLAHGRVSLRGCRGVQPRGLRLKRDEAPPCPLRAVGEIQGPGGRCRRDCWEMAGCGQEGSGGLVRVGFGGQPTSLQPPQDPLVDPTEAACQGLLPNYQIAPRCPPTD